MRYHIVSIPGQGEVFVSDRMLPALFEMMQRLSISADRRIVEAPYTVGLSADLIEGWLVRQVYDDAEKHKRSVVSISPVRLIPLTGDRGKSYVEYTSVPLIPWKEDRHG